MEEPKVSSPEPEGTDTGPENDASQTAEAPEAPEQANETAEEALAEKIQRLESENQELYDRFLRQRAEFENVRKRHDREAKEKRDFAEAGLVESLLPVLDAFERALASLAGSGQDDYYKGLELVYKQLLDTLTRAGLKPLESLGRTFDPFFHHAVERLETTEHPDQQIVEELQRGYLFKDRMLRPALVKVAVHPADPSPQEPEN